MEIIPLIVMVFPVLLLIGIGLLIKNKKAYWLISGYNTMPEEKKKQVDIAGLGNFVANMCFLFAVLITLAALLMALRQMVLSIVVFIIILPAVVFAIIKAQKYDGNAKEHTGKLNRKNKIAIAAVVVFVFLIAAGTGLLLFSGAQPAEFTIDRDKLVISGMYGQDIAIQDIESIELKETMPEVTAKTNGSQLNTMLKGFFRIKDAGEALLFVNTGKSPYVFIKTKTRRIILNCPTEEETKQLFESLNDVLQK